MYSFNYLHIDGSHFMIVLNAISLNDKMVKSATQCHRKRQLVSTNDSVYVELYLTVF